MKTILHRHLSFFALLGILFVFCNGQTGHAQGNPQGKNKSPFPVKYTSEIDQKINLRTITLAPVYDNVNRVYADPIQKLLIELLQNDKVWGYSAFPESNKKLFVETYDTNSKDVLEALNNTGSQGLLTAIITKGPNGLSATLRLYTADQGLILAEESFQDLTTFEIPKLREEFITLYQNIKNKLPYRAFIMSRRGLEVTFNAGSKSGLNVGQELAIAQIIKVNRHPKLKYLVSTEKEIIGRVQITKVEPYLSFAQIIFEKEAGVVAVGAKLLPTDSISYPRPVINSSGEVIDDKVTALSHATSEPADTPSPPAPVTERMVSGKALLLLGVGQFAESGRFNSGATVESSQALAPSLLLGAEFWFRKNWFANLNLMQSNFSASNTFTTSSPANLNYSYAKYAASVGYFFLLRDNFHGPKLSTQLGYAMYKTDVTDTNPTAFTSTNSGGILAKVTGSFPLQPEYPFSIGASFDIMLTSQFTESPQTSGAASARISSFGLNTSFQASKVLQYRFDLNFDQIQAEFGGAGLKRSSTVKMTTQLFGIEYLF